MSTKEKMKKKQGGFTLIAQWVAQLKRNWACDVPKI